MSGSDHKLRAPTLWQTIGSVLAAAVGIQSERNRQRDFSGGRPWRFVVFGLIGTVLFVLTIVGVVQLVLSQAGQ